MSLMGVPSSHFNIGVWGDKFKGRIIESTYLGCFRLEKEGSEQFMFAAVYVRVLGAS